ncbi:MULTISPECIES: pyridoxamine 5'-phosphate oxidase family protein [unclassified Rhizobium]|uniref:pyridoxamine 5'-phosphate oxidase family protein n=1 Tax=unclassified Rhizobium TaxID=2613769 RepID=UPI00071397D7|nr:MULTISPECIES: pyridoxamine 5'-phosphate oxidase family protein [unclassified Rhizobium]KQS87762.1 hypothetical protein ASG50_08880 [Rhizobium sp. Leaf386]KQS94680.1 hypothetical protein ASG42_08415 [Rhizobium sp. Leaf391]KQU01695.1 hypothetical protein ASG68_08200 [Rhizobium sp. Leaf453]
MTDIAQVWDVLHAAATSRSPFNFLQLATIGLDGSPQLRTIVLRGCDRDKATVSFVTDMRSPKVAEILRDPRVSLVGFDGEKSVQLRLSGIASVVADDVARKSMWDRLRHRTLVLFDAPFAPGTPIDGEGNPLAPMPDDDGSAGPYEKFALVSVTVERLDWLDLSSELHQRYTFSGHAGAWRRTRILP